MASNTDRANEPIIIKNERNWIAESSGGNEKTINMAVPDRICFIGKQHKNYADAFLLRFFHGVIYKIENPDDDAINDIYRNNGRPYYEGVWAREWSEMMLMEKEHNLWEF